MKRTSLKAMILIATLSLASGIATAQERQIGVGVAVNVGVLHGVGLEGAVELMPELAVRGGISVLPVPALEQKGTFGLDDAISDFEQYVGFRPNMSAKMKLSNLTGQLLVDYYPWRGSFHLTTGLKFGGQLMDVVVMAVNEEGVSIMQDPRVQLDPNDMPELTFSDSSDNPYILKPNGDASLTARVSSKNSVQPYLGIGWGRAVPTSRVGLRFNMGVLYAGDLQLTSPNLVSGDFNTLLKSEKEVEKYVKYAKFLPVLNFSVTFRIL